MTDQKIDVEKNEDSFIFTVIEEEDATNIQGEKVTLENKKEIKIPKDEDITNEIIKVLGEYQLSKNPPKPKTVSQKMDEVYDR